MTQIDRRTVLRQAGVAAGLAAVGTVAAGAVPAAGTPLSSGVSAPAHPTPHEALTLLKEGNDRFVAGEMTHPNQDPARRKEVAAGQEPFAVVFSCIDSRVPPEIVFDRGLGDLFVIRTGAQDYDCLIEGSVEYGPVLDHTPLLVVMGHQRCGAVTAAVNALESGTTPAPNLDAVVQSLSLAYAVAKKTGADDLVEATVRAQIRLTARALRRDPALRPNIARGMLTVVGAYYSLETGEVSWQP
ncbi:carbonic anhydrase [Streptomyces sp. NPDC048665]|uniref:carbonic anhydrase n=1 Tax=Streptomyces sp. NPDC048665 TaxID=3155490 RepID=UPI00342D0A5C